MSNDNRFGRRNASVRPPELQGQARQRRAEAGGQAEYAVGDVPAPAETSQSQTLLYVAAGVAVLFVR